MNTPDPARLQDLWREPRLSRRTLVAIAAMAPILTACGSTDPGPSADPLEAVFIQHPPTLAFAAPFLLVQQGGALAQYAKSVEVGEVASGELLGSMLVNGEVDIIAAPTHVGASLANEGYAVSLAAVLVWGNLWLIGPEDAAPEWASLRGQKISIPLPNDVPDLVFQFLADANKLGKYDYQVEHHADPAEVMARVERGDSRWAVLPEHLATAALNQANQNGHRLKRAINLQEAWAGATGGRPRFPEAGIILPTELAQQRPDVIRALLDDLARSIETINAAEAQTVDTIAAGTAVPAPVVADVIPRLHLELVPAAQARPELEAFYTNLNKLSPDIIGGRLPDASFYLDDPR